MVRPSTPSTATAPYDYFDLSASYSFRAFDLRAGVNNVFGAHPPIIGYGSHPLLLNGNLLAGDYDSFGSELFVEIVAHF